MAVTGKLTTASSQAAAGSGVMPQIAAMLGRSTLQYMPDQNSASPLYGTTDDHDGNTRGGGWTRRLPCAA